jgi:hypothetical protein
MPATAEKVTEIRPARATWEGPSRRQRAYIARLTLELLGIPYPASEQEASAVIARLKNAVEAGRVDGGTDDIPF